MTANRTVRKILLVLPLGLSMLAATPASSQQPIQPAPIPHQSGQGIAPACEGWFKNPDGTFSLSFGYLNRNFEQVSRSRHGRLQRARTESRR